MAKKARSHDDESDVTTNQEEGSQDTTSVTGGPEVDEGNPPTGAGQPYIQPPDGSQPQADPNQQSGGDIDQADDPSRPKTQAELDEDKPPLSKDEAIALLKAGHRLRIKGDDPTNWLAMTRHGGDLVVSYPATDEAVDEALASGDFILAE